MRAALCLVAIALLTGCAEPPENPRHREIIFGPAPGTTLNPAGPPQTMLAPVELGICARLLRDINADNRRYATQDPLLADRRRALDARQAELQAERPTLHVPDSQMAKFNADVAAHDAAVARFNAATQALNQDKQATANRVAQFNATCAGHSYWLDDMDQIDASLGGSHA